MKLESIEITAYVHSCCCKNLLGVGGGLVLGKEKGRGSRGREEKQVVEEEEEDMTELSPTCVCTSSLIHSLSFFPLSTTSTTLPPNHSFYFMGMFISKLSIKIKKKKIGHSNQTE